jgi:hypothetical protein
MNASFDLDAVDVRAVPCMTNTTCDTEVDKTGGNGFTTIDEFNGSGYTAGGFTLLNDLITRVTTGDLTGYTKYDADDWAMGAIGAGTRSVQGIWIVKFDTALTNALTKPLAWLEFASPWAGDGSSRTIVWPANGLFRIKHV